MGDCLKTQLKGEVQNNELLYLKELKIDVVQNASGYNEYSALLPIRNTKACKVIAKNGAYFAETYAGLDDVATRLTSLDIPANTTKNIFVGNVSGELRITEKYTLTVLGHEYGRNYPSMIVNLDDLKYSSDIDTINVGFSTGNLESILDKPLKYIRMKDSSDFRIKASSIAFNSTLRIAQISGLGVNGDLSQLNSYSSLSTFEISNTSVTGNIKLIAKLPIASSFNKISSNIINGTIEELVAAYVDGTYGVTAATYDGKNLGQSPCLGNVTFGGINHNTNAAFYTFLSWNSKTQIWLSYNGNNLASCTKIIAKGCTAEQIAAWEQAGKDVTVIG